MVVFNDSGDGSIGDFDVIQEFGPLELVYFKSDFSGDDQVVSVNSDDFREIIFGKKHVLTPIGESAFGDFGV